MAKGARWDRSSYQRMAHAVYDNGELHIAFEDGTDVSVLATKTLPPSVQDVNWREMSVSPFEIVVPASEGEVTIPWTTIRVLVDSAFSAHLAQVAEAQAREIGSRIRQLRNIRGLTSKELAIRAGISQQSLSRIELGHHSVILPTLQRILAAMGYGLGDLVEGRSVPQSLNSLQGRLRRTGIDSEFVRARLFGADRKVVKHGSDSDTSHLDELIERVGRVFNWSRSSILGHGPLNFDAAAIRAAHFKVPNTTNEQRVTMYTLYAHYLAHLVLKATPSLPYSSIPGDPGQLRAEVVEHHGALTLDALLRTAWRLGVPVLPLYDPGAFHGACWRINDRAVVVLKQVTKSQGRWLFDLAHELKHVASHLVEGVPGIVETAEITPFEQASEEKEASEFASNLLLYGRSEELAQRSVTVARGSVEKLKRAVVTVSTEEQVPVDVLANYMAYRLRLQGKDWWGTANSLQQTNPHPWSIAKAILLEHLNVELLDTTDRTLLELALINPYEERM